VGSSNSNDDTTIRLVDSMARVETTLAAMNEKMDTHIDRHQRWAEELFPRINKIEGRQKYFIGFASAISALIAFVTSAWPG